MQVALRSLWGSSINRTNWGNIRNISVLLSLVLAACSDPIHEEITSACVKSAATINISRTDTVQKCECVASTAQKYLDKDDYELFGDVMGIYNSNDDQDVKAFRTISTLEKAGITESRAMQLFVSFGFLAERLDKECSAS